MNRPVSISLVLIALTARAVSVSAQESVPGWVGLATSSLETVYVLDDMGSETRGMLVGLDEDSISLLVNGIEQRFERQRVHRIDKRGDSLKNGALVGAVVGVVLSAISAAAADCPSTSDTSCPGAKVALAIAGTAVYTGIGVGVDALFTGRTTMYEASTAGAFGLPDRQPGIAVSGRGVVRLSLRW